MKFTFFISYSTSTCREVNENNALLKEQATSVEAKLVRAEKRTEELAKLQVENEVSCNIVFKILLTDDSDC